MFGKLKEKLKSWAAKFTKETGETIVEEPKKKVVEKKPAKVEKKTIKTPSKKEIQKTKENRKELVEKKSKEKEISLPMKFQPGEQKFEPDLEKIREIEEKVEEQKEEKQGFFSRLASKISKITVSEEQFNVYAEELEMLLLENNVALEVTEKIIKDLKEKIVGKEMLKKEIEGQINEALKDIIYEILIEPFDVVEKIKNRENKQKPYVILFCGINGTGKTTSIAKIADSLKKQKISCILAAADTFRAASIEQIKKHGEKIGVTVIAHEYESDPASVGFDAIKYAEKNKIDCVLIDTAGRMHTAKNLMTQIEKIVRVTKPDLKIYVGESTTGNDAIEQVRSFNFTIGIDGIILSKADIDEKGGTALSVGYVTKRPILYLGTGQEYSAIEQFNKQKFIERLGL